MRWRSVSSRSSCARSVSALQAHQEPTVASYQHIVIGSVEPLLDVPQRGAFHELEEKTTAPAGASPAPSRHSSRAGRSAESRTGLRRGTSCRSPLPRLRFRCCRGAEQPRECFIECSAAIGSTEHGPTVPLFRLCAMGELFATVRDTGHISAQRRSCTAGRSRRSSLVASIARAADHGGNTESCVRVGGSHLRLPGTAGTMARPAITEIDGSVPVRTARLTMHGSVAPSPQGWRASPLPSSSRAVSRNARTPERPFARQIGRTG